MSLLADRQRALVEALLDGGEAVTGHLRSHGPLDASDRLAIYRGSVRAALTQALAEVYPVLRRLVGDAFFDALASRYQAVHPSTSPDLHDYGAALAEFLAPFPPAAALPYLPDVARLEWAWHRVFHAAEPPPFAAEALNQALAQNPGALRLTLSPALRLLHSAYPVERIWRANQPDVTEPPGISLDEGPAWLVIWRQGETVDMNDLPPQDWRLLQAIEGGASLNELACLEPALDRRLPPLLSRGWLQIAGV